MPDYCGRCGSPFEVDLDYGEVRPDELFEGGVTDLWKCRALYPLSSHQYGFELSLGEGGPFGSRLESRSKERAGSGLGCGSRGIRIATLRGVRAMLTENGIRRFTNIPQLRFRASLTEDGSRRVILWKA